MRPLAGWDRLPVADRYLRLAQIARGFALIVDAAADHDEFVEQVLVLRDIADATLNGDAAFTYLSPADCWERNLPLTAVGWRYPGMVGDDFDGIGLG